MKLYTVFVFLFFYNTFGFSQSQKYFDRIQALKNGDLTFYNTDGYVISSETFNQNYDEKGLKKVLKKYSITNEDVQTPDDSLGYKNIRISRKEKAINEIVQYSTYYFIENIDKTIIAVQFGNINYSNTKLERQITKDIIEKNIPLYCYNKLKPDSLNFAGRKIFLNKSCYWTNINTIQCPYYGEFNWSIHENLYEAKEAIKVQELVTKSKKVSKVESEEIITVLFEGTEVTAKKIVYGFSKLTSSVVGAKQLTVYYVAAFVRERNISCVLSHWNNDNIGESGLPPLLEQVMKLKNKE